VSVAHIDLETPSVEPLAPSRALWRLAGVLSGLGMLALAAVPAAVAVLLLTRPDLLLPL
jgi:hypothetical protein